ncbi:bromo adjacent homology domain, zinc finger, RING/FYVE/PHD-type containing protein [Tanacetum coccineum]
MPHNRPTSNDQSFHLRQTSKRLGLSKRDLYNGLASFDAHGVPQLVVVHDGLQQGSSDGCVTTHDASIQPVRSRCNDVEGVLKNGVPTRWCCTNTINKHAHYKEVKDINAKCNLSRFKRAANGVNKTSESKIRFCKYKMSFNPDLYTLKCEACKERYHPDCINMTIDEAKQLADNFICDCCLTPDNQGSAFASATVDP